MTATRERVSRTVHARRIPLPSFHAKWLMAVTGIIFTAFVLVHMYGNLHIYYGQAEFDHYAHWLRELLMPLLPYEGVLWILRIVLLVSLVVHLGCGALLFARARRARGPHRRAGMRRPGTWLARSMPGTGIVLLLFVIFHILDLTIGAAPVAPEGFQHGAAYANLVASFQRPLVALFYALAMLALAAHIAHGTWTAAHDLGVTGRRTRRAWFLAGGAIALAICLGNLSIPIMVMLGGIR